MERKKRTGKFFHQKWWFTKVKNKKNIQFVFVGLLISYKMKWPLTTEKPETFLADRENRQGCVQAYLLTEKICSN